MFDGAAMAAEVVKTVREYVAKATEPLLAQIADLQAKIAAVPVPRDGKDVDPLEVKAMVDAAVGALPLPKDGAPGKDADPVDVDAVVARVAAAIPAPKDGAPGKDAEPIDLDTVVARVAAVIPTPKNGEPGRDAEVDYAKVKELVDGAVALLPAPAAGKDAAPVDLDAVVARVAAAIPAPKDGNPGKDAEVDYDRIGKAIEEVVAAIPLPKDGAPGKDAEPIHPDTLELMVVKQVDAAVKNLPVIVKNGEPGKDGLSLDDFDLTLGEDGRTLTMRLMHGETLVEKSIKLAVQIYRGVYKSGAPYEHGDTATWDGSTWHCERDTKAEPGNGSDWKLMVKRGAPGKDGNSKQGDPGPPGRPGRDLTHMMPDGSKY